MSLCFGIMPITTPPDLLERYDNDPQHFLRVAKHIFKPAAEAAGFEFKAPTSTSAEIIQAEIIANLERADLVLCDISTWNANVFFELGIRVALDKPVAMVRDHHTDRIPFDNSMVNTHTYDGRLDIYRVEETVPELAAFLRGAKTQDQNALWKYFGIRQQATRADPGNPEDAKLNLILAELSALRRAAAGRNAQLPRGLTLATLDSDIRSAIPPWDDTATEMIGRTKTLRVQTRRKLDYEGLLDQIAETALPYYYDDQVQEIQFFVGKAAKPYRVINLPDYTTERLEP